MKKLGWVHITKTAGTHIGQYLKLNYPDINIQGLYRGNFHQTTAANIPLDSLILASVRNPYDRFVSAYNYYLYGSELYYKNIGNFIRTKDIKVFINRVLPNILRRSAGFVKGHGESYIWNVHFLRQCDFLDERRHKDTIILVYNNDLNRSLLTLSEYLHTEISFPEGKKIFPEKTNLTSKKKQFTEQEKKYILDFLKVFYKADYQLFETIRDNPEKFRKIIQ